MSHRGEIFQHGKQRCTQKPKTEQPVEQRYASLVGKFLHKLYWKGCVYGSQTEKEKGLYVNSDWEEENDSDVYHGRASCGKCAAAGLVQTT